MIETLVVIMIGGSIFLYLDWTSWNPPSWVVKVKMWRKRK